MARADAEAGKVGSALALYRRAIAAATPQDAARLSAGGMPSSTGRRTSPPSGRRAKRRRNRTYVPNSSSRWGRSRRARVLGMASYAFDRAARTGGKGAREAAESLFRSEKIAGPRPKIVGIVPLSGKLSDIGFSVLSGAEVALARTIAARRMPACR